MIARPRFQLLLLMALAPLALSGVRCPGGEIAARLVELEAGPDLEFQLRGALLEATPGTIIQLPAGTFAFRSGVTVTSDHVTLRGEGPDATVLDFTNQLSGSQGILARGDHFSVSSLAVVNPAGDGIKTEFVNGATFDRVRVEWTAGPSTDNGDYGLYPARSRNVLVHECTVIGARDAGIYVGQSENIVVRNSFVKHNVLGIEIENSIDADVYGNHAVANTAGIAIFNLPDLQVDGHTNRVFDNLIEENDTPNFAAGGILAMVPGGTGIVVIAGQDVEIFDNVIRGNDTANMFISGFQISLENITDADFDPYAEGIHVHGNEFVGGGDAPQDLLGQLVSGFFEGQAPDITIGGFVDPDKVPGGLDPTIVPPTLQVADELRICIRDNGDADFGSLQAITTPSVDASPHDCSHPPLPTVALELVEWPELQEPEYTEEEIEALCNADGAGPNRDAFVVDCPELSDYRLFASDPREQENPWGEPYDLTTPLFSDHALKYRMVFLPPDTMATYQPSDPFDFPVGTVIAKTFAFENEVERPGEIPRMVETRLLIHRTDGWAGLPFIWNAAQTEAELSIGGGIAEVTLTDPTGTLHTTEYEIPSTADCGSCHFGPAGDEPIGPKARLLNRDYPYPTGAENQLARWTRLGLLQGAPAPADAPYLPVWNDPSDGTLEERAKAYLESNCAHCHNPEGRAGFTGMWLSHDAPLDTNYGICKRPVAAGSGALGLLFDIVPGAP